MITIYILFIRTHFYQNRRDKCIQLNLLKVMAEQFQGFITSMSIGAVAGVVVNSEVYNGEIRDNHIQWLVRDMSNGNSSVDIPVKEIK